MGAVAQVFANICLRDKFIAPVLVLNPTHGLDPGSIRNLGPKICGASGSTTLKLQLRSSRLPNH